MSVTTKPSCTGNPLLHPLCRVPGPAGQDLVILQWQHYAPCLHAGRPISLPTRGGTVVGFVDQDQTLRIYGTIDSPPVNLMPVLSMHCPADKSTIYFQTLDPDPVGECRPVLHHWKARWDAITCRLEDPKLFNTGEPDMIRHNTGLVCWQECKFTIRRQDVAIEYELPIQVYEAHQDGDAWIIVGGPSAARSESNYHTLAIAPEGISFVYRFQHDILECAVNGAGQQISARSAAWLPSSNTLVHSMNTTREMRLTTNQTQVQVGVGWELVSKGHTHTTLTRGQPPKRERAHVKQTWRAWTSRLFSLPVEELPADLVELRVDYDKAVAEAGGEACTNCELGTIRKAYLKRLKKIYE